MNCGCIVCLIGLFRIQSSNKASNAKFLKIPSSLQPLINSTKWRDLCGVSSLRLMVPKNMAIIGHVWRRCTWAIQSDKKVIWKSYFLITKSFEIIRVKFFKLSTRLNSEDCCLGLQLIHFQINRSSCLQMLDKKDLLQNFWCINQVL